MDIPEDRVQAVCAVIAGEEVPERLLEMPEVRFALAEILSIAVARRLRERSDAVEAELSEVPEPVVVPLEFQSTVSQQGI